MTVGHLLRDIVFQLLVDLSIQKSPESTFPFASKHRFEKNAEILEKEATAH